MTEGDVVEEPNVTGVGGEAAEPEPERLTDNEEMLLRQVRPEWFETGVPSSQTFEPLPKDKGEVSVSRSALTTPQEAFAHHTEVLGYTSVGVWGVTVGEVDEEGLEALHKPVVVEPVDPAHSVIDFRARNRSQSKKKAKLLLAKAKGRGCLYPSSAA